MTLAEIITAARDIHPAFERRRVPSGVVARFLTRYQRRLFSRAVRLNPDYQTQRILVYLSLSAANQPATVGAGAAGGLPAALGEGSVATAPGSAGAAFQVDLDDVDAVVLVSESLANGATATTLTKTSAGWTVDQFIGAYARITSGPGYGQVREILSNTADTLTTTAFAIPPVAGESLFDVVQAVLEADETKGVFTAIPAKAEETAYLVKLDAQGVPYIDTTTPLVASFDVGVPLPQYTSLKGGDVVFSEPVEQARLTIVSYGSRYDAPGSYTVRVTGRELFLLGEERDWGSITHLVVYYSPVPPALTALTDLFLLTDVAFDALVAKAGWFMASRLPEMPKADLLQDAIDAEEEFLQNVAADFTGRVSYVPETW